MVLYSLLCQRSCTIFNKAHSFLLTLAQRDSKLLTGAPVKLQHLLIVPSNSPRRRQTADTPPARRAAAAPTSSCCCPASSLFDGPGIYGGARVPLSSALRAGGQRLALRDCARVDRPSPLWSLHQRYPKKKKEEEDVEEEGSPP